MTGGVPSAEELRTKSMSSSKGALARKFATFLPKRQFEKVLPAEAARLGVSVVRVEEIDLLAFIGEARSGFSQFRPREER